MSMEIDIPVTAAARRDMEANREEALDDDGLPRRTGELKQLLQVRCILHACVIRVEQFTGTVWTASAHIITAVIGSGVLSLAWAMAQLGWAAGSVSLVLFSVITLYTSSLLADCYRTGDPCYGTRNYTYMAAVKSNLGPLSSRIATIGKAAKQIAVFPPASSWLGSAWSKSLCLSAKSVISGEIGETSITGTVVGVDVTAAEKIWKSFQALGNIAFAYSYSLILIEIQDTLRSPAENKVMKRATVVGVAVTTVFYILCGCLGYVAFGNKAPGNMLTGFGFYEPFWLIDIANICIVVHLLGAYQAILSLSLLTLELEFIFFLNTLPLSCSVGVQPATVCSNRTTDRPVVSQLKPTESRASHCDQQSPWLQRQRFPTGMEDWVRDHEHDSGHHHALLQRSARVPGSSGVLAAHGLLSDRDVHRSERCREVFHQVGVLAMLELRVLPHLRDRGLCFHSRRDSIIKALLPIPYEILSSIIKERLGKRACIRFAAVGLLEDFFMSRTA
ncbi:hypothetical protein ZIOFF_008412 [Zingiber officinale]|uniref:Amino acid transporter transmembrane domain-containing protein n=1 Tax=Zingiber officinale TaxID=94328 RepID=A0A8J5LTP5_ZINOF|nr:hypothetical protein ZIOFF_008412 [Zingiber officinale]